MLELLSKLLYILSNIKICVDIMHLVVYFVCKMEKIWNLSKCIFYLI